MQKRTDASDPPRSRNQRSAASAPDGVWPPGGWRAQLRRRLLAWYDRHRRELPWRGSRDPYCVWVSEIMLQQTQVATVSEYYPRFVQALPDVRRLAAADETTVLRLWEGLGYYRRARQLHRAARVVVDELGGELPQSLEGWCGLPGVGRYTAGAILSIAHDEPHPILEANTQRLYSRLLALEGDVSRGAGRRLLWIAAEQLLSRQRPGDLNQALMELGSTVCLPRRPSCSECPLAGLCPTYKRGWQERIGGPQRGTPLEDVREAAVVVRRRGRVLVVLRGDEGRWAGLWDFPRFTLDSHQAADIAHELIAKVAAATGSRIAPPEWLTTMRHGVTRFRITLECYEARHIGALPPAAQRRGDRPPANGVPGSSRHSLRQGGLACTAVEVRWLRPVDLATLPLSTTGRRLADLLCEPK